MAGIKKCLAIGNIVFFFMLAALTGGLGGLANSYGGGYGFGNTMRDDYTNSEFDSGIQGLMTIFIIIAFAIPTVIYIS